MQIYQCYELGGELMGSRKDWSSYSADVDPSWANWKKPVYIQITDRRREVIENPAEALIYISNRWPCTIGAQAEIAKRSCSLVLRRKINTEDAYEAFVSAAAEAQILVKPLA